MKNKQNQQKEMSATIGAVITAVPDGKKPFVVTYPDDRRFSRKNQKRRSITFTLSAWKGDDKPRAGQSVMLEGVNKFRRGWRAVAARPILLENV